MKLYSPNDYSSVDWLRGIEHRTIRYGGLLLAHGFIGVAAMFSVMGAPVAGIGLFAIAGIMLWRLL